MADPAAHDSRADTTGDENVGVSSPLELLAVAVLLAVPVAVVPSGSGGITLVSLWGFVNTGGTGAVSDAELYPIWSYFADGTLRFATLPSSIRVWPVALGFHLLAVASAAGGVVLGREDRRVTGGLLVLGALASLWVTIGVAERFGVSRTVGWLAVLPTGAAATLVVALVGYGSDLREGLRR